MKEYRFSEQETKELIGGFAKLHRMAVTAGELAEIVKLHLVPSEKDAFPVMQALQQVCTDAEQLARMYESDLKGDLEFKGVEA